MSGRSLTVKSYTKGCIVWYKQENLVVSCFFKVKTVINILFFKFFQVWFTKNNSKCEKAARQNAYVLQGTNYDKFKIKNNLNFQVYIY